MSKVSVLMVACVALGALAAPSALARPTLLTTINVTAGKPTEFHFVLSKSTAKRGIIVFKFANAGQLSLRVTVLLKGTYEYLCTVPGHAAGGMKGLLKVT